MDNIIITAVTSIIVAIVASCLTNAFNFRSWQIKSKIEYLTKLNNACLRLDSTFQEYLKLDNLLESSYYGLDENGNRYTQDKLHIEAKLVAIIDEIYSLQNVLDDNQLLKIVEEYIQLFRKTDNTFMETCNESYSHIKSSVSMSIKKELLKQIPLYQFLGTNKSKYLYKIIGRGNGARSPIK